MEFRMYMRIHVSPYQTRPDQTDQTTYLTAHLPLLYFVHAYADAYAAASG